MTATLSGCAGVLSRGKHRQVRQRGQRRLALATPAVPPAPVWPSLLWAPQSLDLGALTPALPLPAEVAFPSDLGVTYLVCIRDEFGEHASLGHSRHYLGWALDLGIRMREHREGTGGRLLQYVAEAGLTWTVARIWPSTTRVWEAQLKRWGGAVRICPLCSPVTAARRALHPERVSGAGDGGQPGMVISVTCSVRVYDWRRVGRHGLDGAWRACGRDGTQDHAGRWVCGGCDRQLRALAELGRADQVRWDDSGWARPRPGRRAA